MFYYHLQMFHLMFSYCFVKLSCGIVPDDMKIAKVVPIYKKDSPELFGNYIYTLYL